jgi:hypothetical protein
LVISFFGHRREPAVSRQRYRACARFFDPQQASTDYEAKKKKQKCFTPPCDRLRYGGFSGAQTDLQQRTTLLLTNKRSAYQQVTLPILQEYAAYRCAPSQTPKTSSAVVSDTWAFRPRVPAREDEFGEGLQERLGNFQRLW